MTQSTDRRDRTRRRRVAEAVAMILPALALLAHAVSEVMGRGERR